MITILSSDEAKKIAAGEVIDRPAALVRELIDNAIDAGAENIELSVEEGGIKKIELIDDGCGMSRDDLELCIKTHATSKIKTLDDLSSFTTLGFRGEALAAAAAAARLEILTSTDGKEAWLLESETSKISATRRNRGTSVRAFGLFDSIPARKRFLKRESSEAALCRQIVTEKALAFPGISFRFFQDGVLKLNVFPENKISPEENNLALQKRFGSLILDSNERVFLHTMNSNGKGYKTTIVFGGPELFRKDRRQQFIFANKRRINDFGLMQALEYGLTGFFPNGTHPLGAVFIEIDPALADFNIHPAKREVRFADAGAIHHSITAALRSYTHHHTQYNTHRHTHNDTHQELAMKALLERSDDFISTAFAAEKQALYSADATPGGQNIKTTQQNFKSIPGTIRLVGQVFGLFIIIEQGDKIFLIDQHAAHERILYDHFLAGHVTVQELLVPAPFSTGSSEEDDFLLSKKEQLAALGIVLEHEGQGAWYIRALPAGWKKTDTETAETILALQKSKGNLAENWAATLACHAAIKDHSFLDDTAALSLAQAVLALATVTGSVPRCPHGRPLWTELSREELFRAVRRKE